MSNSPFTVPGEQGWRLWRALAEANGVVLLLFLTHQGQDFGPGLGDWLEAGLGAVALALFTVRRRFPLLSLLGLCVIMSVLLPAALPAAVAAYTTARQTSTPRRRSALLLSAAGAAVLSSVVLPPLTQGGASASLALGIVLAATVVIVPGLVGTAGGQQERLVQALHERTLAAEEARQLADSASRMQERSRIAAEMHDLIGHRLSLISLHAGGLEMALREQSPDLRDEAALVRRTTGDAMRELREVLGVLRPLGRDAGTGVLTDATGTLSDIQTLVEESQRGGILVALVWNGADLDIRPAQVRRAVHRVVRESLTNVHRYAAGARVTVTITHTDDRVDIVVRNGVPPVSSRPDVRVGTGRGLIGLRERVTLLGGTLRAEPTPAGGFTVRASIPAEPDTETIPTEPDDQSYPPSGRVLPGKNLAGLPRRVARALTGVVGLAGMSALVLLGITLVDHAKPGPGPQKPEELRIGMSRSRVERAVLGDSEVVRAAATGREPARSASVTSCIYPMPPLNDALLAAGRFDITRYCFRGDKLATIDCFTVPLVSQTSPRRVP